MSVPTRLPRHPIATALLLIASAPALSAQSARPAPRSDSVWVNPRSRVYHCPGSSVYGRTARGSVMGEAEARREGYRPAGGAACATRLPPSAADAARLTRAPERPDDFHALLLAGPASPRSDDHREACEVARVVDGDTIECRNLGLVRLIGIDTPERGEGPLYGAATSALRTLIPVGTKTILERDVQMRDRHGRRLRYLWSDGVMANWVMVRLGWAKARAYRPDTAYVGELTRAMATAREEQRGFWSDTAFACLLADRRRGQC